MNWLTVIIIKLCITWNEVFMQIREMDLKELYPIYDVVKQLRTELSYDEFEDTLYDMRHMEYKMFGLLEKEQLITYAGVAVQTNLYDKRHLFVFELVTDANFHSMGYGKMMLEFLEDYAKTCMCERVVLSSGFARERAHTFYEKNGFEKKGYVFRKTL